MDSVAQAHDGRRVHPAGNEKTLQTGITGISDYVPRRSQGHNAAVLCWARSKKPSLPDHKD